MAKHYWSEDEDSLLGKATDAEVAKRLGLQRSTVKNRRVYLKIRAFKAPPKLIKWSDYAISRLGIDKDADVAKHLGCSQEAVCKKRRALGISKAESLRRSRESKFAWGEESVSLLGAVTDKEVADRLGCSLATVRKKRKELGISPYRKPAKATEWQEIKYLDQPLFWTALKDIWRKRHRKELTYKQMASLSHYSYSRVQKWFAPGSGQQPLSITTRHHMYLAVRHLRPGDCK